MTYTYDVTVRRYGLVLDATFTVDEGYTAGSMEDCREPEVVRADYGKVQLDDFVDGWLGDLIEHDGRVDALQDWLLSDAIRPLFEAWLDTEYGDAMRSAADNEEAP